MQGGPQRGDRRDLTATTAYAAADESDDSLDNMVAGAIAASSWTHDDLLVALAAVNVALLVALSLYEVTN